MQRIRADKDTWLLLDFISRRVRFLEKQTRFHKGPLLNRDYREECGMLYRLLQEMESTYDFT